MLLPSKSNVGQKDVEKTANILKDRPNISITPVTHTISSIVNPPKQAMSAHPKTLQEKLADKQKQHKNIDKMSHFTSATSKSVDKGLFTPISSSKGLDFGTKPVDKVVYSTAGASAFKNTSLSNISIPSSLNVFPTFSKESSYINQVGAITKPAHFVWKAVA